MNLSDLTIKRARTGLAEKKFSATDLTKVSLDAIRKNEPKVHAFITITEKEALTASLESDKRLSNGNARPLEGIPFTMKDVFNTKGIKTTASSKVLDDYIPAYSATVYQLLLDAGAILLGKTNCDAFGHGSSTENSDFGPTKNPWNLDRVPGGSSGGSSASLAYGGGLFSIAEDTGGSIRQPAAFCGVTGLKPTWGVISRYGCISYASSLDTVGPMTRSAEDIGEIMQVIGEQDSMDASQGFREPIYDYKRDIGSNKYKIGFPKEFRQTGNDPEIDTAIENAIKKLEELGHEVVEVSLPHTKYAIECYYLLAASETSSNLARYDGVRFGNPREYFNDENKRRIMLGTFALSAGYSDEFYLKASKVRTLIYEDFRKLENKGIEIFIAPVSPILPFKLGEKSYDPLQMYLADIYTVSINVSAIPSLALPCGFSKAGLPIGMQLMGKHFAESQLIGLGKQYQEATDWHKRKPKL